MSRDRFVKPRAVVVGDRPGGGAGAMSRDRFVKPRAVVVVIDLEEALAP